MTRDEWRFDPCTQEAIFEGCTCRMSSVDSATIDPSHEFIDKDCPLHGWAQAPDYEYESDRDDARDFPVVGDDYD